MKSNLKIFREESFDLEMMLKNKLKLFQSPVDLLNEKEIKELKFMFDDYSKKVEKLILAFNELNNAKLEKGKKGMPEEPNSHIYLQLYDEVLKKHKYLQAQIEDYIMKYEEKEKEKQILISTQRIKDDNNSEFSEYADTERLEISRIFLNSVITTIQVNELQNKQTLEEELKFILEVFNLKEFYPNSVPKQEILRDFYISNYKFCLKQKFTIEKISTFLSIMYFIFTFSVMNKKIIKDRSMNIFVDIIDYHSLNRPPYSYEIFSIEERNEILSFVNTTFYRNYTLFENIFKYNLNIYFHSLDFKPIPFKDIPTIQNIILNDEYIMKDPKSLEIINKLYFENDKKVVEENIKKESKSDIELKEEAALEKLRTFVNSFYKSKETAENEKLMLEQMKKAKIIEFEVEETRAFIESKLPEIIKEVQDKINLANKEYLKIHNSNANPIIDTKIKK